VEGGGDGAARVARGGDQDGADLAGDGQPVHAFGEEAGGEILEGRRRSVEQLQHPGRGIAVVAVGHGLDRQRQVQAGPADFGQVVLERSVGEERFQYVFGDLGQGGVLCYDPTSARGSRSGT
jgi:hypothetical protein